MIAKVREVYEFGYLYKLLPGANKEVYWLVSNKGIDSVLDKQSEYFNICKQDIEKESFEKNCNLLVVEKIDSLKDNSRLFSQILDIEEDPYIFRKYILYFTEDELAELGDLIKKERFNSFITNNASEASFFDEYKNSDTMFSGYSLLYRLMIKLPFLEIKSREETLDDLKKNMKGALTEKGVVKDYVTVSEFLSGKSIDDINNADSAKILEDVLNSFGGDLYD